MMKKSIFKVGFLTTLILILLVSCTSPSEETSAKMPVLTNKQKVANSSALPSVSDVYDLPEYIGALHNASIYAFVDYVQENNLSPYEVGGLTEAMIDTFATNYVSNLLLPILNQFEPNISVSTIILDVLSLEYSTIIDSISDIEEINNVIQERTEYVYGCFGVQEEDMVIYDVIKEIAIATNVLWGSEWDYTIPMFEMSYSASSNEGAENDNMKSEDDVRELKQADIDGAINGAEVGLEIGIAAGTPTLAGAIVSGAWGALIGAAVGATIGSIIECIEQEIEETAISISSETVLPGSYLYQHLSYLRVTHPNKYYELYGNKFEEIFE